MKLKTLTISFSSTSEFLKSARASFYEDTTQDHQNISFDSLETLKKVLNQNRIDILMAIARKKPESIYQLARFLEREHPHVAKDCRSLESLGFITLDEMGGVKKQLVPSLTYDYDVIVVKDKMEKIFSISERSNQVLLDSVTGTNLR